MPSDDADAQTHFLVNRPQIEVGTLVLLLGLTFHLFVRPPHQMWLLDALSHSLSGYHTVMGLPAFVHGSLPTLLHALSFTMITGALAPARASVYVGIVASWFSIHVAFELGQGPGRWLSELAPGWLDHVPFLPLLRHYFALGTFDRGDILAALLGCASAFAMLMSTRHQQGGNA